MASPGKAPRATSKRGRFVVRWEGPDSPPAGAVARLRGIAAFEILDATPRMLLVEAPEEELRAVVEGMPGWLLVPEKRIERPDPRRRARRPS